MATRLNKSILLSLHHAQRLLMLPTFIKQSGHRTQIMSTRARILLSAAVILLALGALVWWLSVRYRTTPVTPVALPNANEAAAENSSRAAPTITPPPNANNNAAQSSTTPAPSPPATNTAEPSATAPPQSLPP